MLAAALLVAVTPLGPGLARVVTLLAEGDAASVRAYPLATGAWAPLVSAALMILQSALAPLPSSPVTYANGLVFGMWWGALLSWASALVAATLCFALSRRFGRPVAERLVTRRALQWSDDFFARFGAYAILLGRLLPFVSFDVVSYGAGLVGVSFPVFIVATALGMIPGTLLYSYLGHLGGESGRALVWTLAALTALALLVTILRPGIARRLVALQGSPRRPGAGQAGQDADITRNDPA